MATSAGDARDLIGRVFDAFFTPEFQDEIDDFMRAKAGIFSDMTPEQAAGGDNKLAWVHLLLAVPRPACSDPFFARACVRYWEVYQQFAALFEDKLEGVCEMFTFGGEVFDIDY
jgi:The ARF-like 2 binding protein BART